MCDCVFSFFHIIIVLIMHQLYYYCTTLPCLCLHIHKGEK